MIVDVLNVQAGENLTEILETPASDEQVRLVLLVYHQMRGFHSLGGVLFCILKHFAHRSACSYM